MRRIATITISLTASAELPQVDDPRRKLNQKDADALNERRAKLDQADAKACHATIAKIEKAIRSAAPGARIVTTDNWRGRRRLEATDNWRGRRRLEGDE